MDDDYEDRIDEIKNSKSKLNSINYLYDACKSTLKIITSSGYASGFFIELEKDNNPFYCIMTNHHVIKKEMIDSKKTIEVYYDNQHKKMRINLDDSKRFIKEFFSDFKIDITIVEILDEDKVNKDFFLLPNLDYIMGYDQFIKKNIFIPQFPGGGNLNNSFGEIIEINSNFDFSHSASTESGSSGSPIFLKETTFVIGIHKQGNAKKIKNYGVFIGPMISYLKNYSNYKKKKYKEGEYDGKIIDDKKEEFGKFIYNDGHCYIGQWKCDKRNGKGILYYKDKKIYEGDFKDNEFN